MLKPTLLLALLFATLPSFAGVVYTATTRTEQGGKAESSTVHAQVSGLGARIEFVQNDAPFLPPGAYLLSRDGGKTLYVIDPAEKTFAKWDMGVLTKDVSDTMDRLKARTSITQPKLEKLLDEPSEPIAGFSTRHYRYRTSYNTNLEIMGSISVLKIVTEEDIWATTKLQDPALAVWLRKTPEPSGDAQLDALLKTEMSKIQGFPLKRITTTTTTDSHGKPQKLTTTMSVSKVALTGVAKSVFAIPEGYKQTEFHLPEQEPQPE